MKKLIAIIAIATAAIASASDKTEAAAARLLDGAKLARTNAADCRKLTKHKDREANARRLEKMAERDEKIAAGMTEEIAAAIEAIDKADGEYQKLAGAGKIDEAIKADRKLSRAIAKYNKLTRSITGNRRNWQH